MPYRLYIVFINIRQKIHGTKISPIRAGEKKLKFSLGENFRLSLYLVFYSASYYYACILHEELLCIHKN